ncbi:HPr family phosphocarrier protein [Fonticella tunisiensis]|uniref:Phosphocarrier protein HPr n=1 Tax=Fonticella tunisiensis TaxID=1096341 RepID=A0A4R7KQC6_9CLOT|nr:HPr family phosphocarrier protein [Fonticella tunisiensis]TDT61360.1 catabolite repression HPr-like protein/phosphocarrier protein [Fonticella tunisiensis]
MIERQITIKRDDGFHARPAAEILKAANKFKSTIYIKKDGKLISAKSILNLLSLALKCGETIELIIDGEDEKQALDEIIGLF